MGFNAQRDVIIPAKSLDTDYCETYEALSRLDTFARNMLHRLFIEVFPRHRMHIPCLKISPQHPSPHKTSICRPPNQLIPNPPVWSTLARHSFPLLSSSLYDGVKHRR
jgi:hypothetical protein